MCMNFEGEGMANGKETSVEDGRKAGACSHSLILVTLSSDGRIPRPPPQRPAADRSHPSAMRRKYAQPALPNLFFRDGVLFARITGFGLFSTQHLILVCRMSNPVDLLDVTQIDVSLRL